MNEAYVLFYLNDSVYALSSNHIKEILRLKEHKINPLPMASPVVKGMMNLRGHIFPAVCTKALLKISSESCEMPKRMVVVQVNGIAYGLLVDQVLGRFKLAENTTVLDHIQILGLDNLFGEVIECRE